MSIAVGGGRLHSSKVRLQRRRGTNGQETVDLQMVPGIGPRNMQKLVEKGIGRVSELKQLYRDKVRRLNICNPVSLFFSILL